MTEEISCGPYTVRTRAHVFYARLNCTARLGALSLLFSARRLLGPLDIVGRR